MAVIDELVAVLGFKYDPKGLDDFKKGMKDVSALAAKGAAALTAMGGAAFAFANQVASAFDETAKLSRQLGLTIQDLRELEYVAERQGVPLNSIKQAFFELNKGLGEFRQKTGPLFNILKELDPALLESVTSAGSLKESFLTLIDAINQAPDVTTKFRIAMAGFGPEAARAMQRVAEAGRVGIADLIGIFRKLRPPISQEAGAIAEAFKDQMANLKVVWEGVRDTIGLGLIDAFLPTLKQLEELYKTNSRLIQTKLKEYVQLSIKWFRNLWNILVDLVSIIKTLLPLLAGLVAGFTSFKILSTITALIVSFNRALTAMAVASAGATGSIARLGAAFMANPIGIIAAAIGVATLALIEFRKHSEYLSVIWQRFADLMDKVWVYVRRNLVGFVDDMKLAADKISSIFMAAFRPITSFIDSIGAKTSALMRKLGLKRPAAEAPPVEEYVREPLVKSLKKDFAAIKKFFTVEKITKDWVDIPLAPAFAPENVEAIRNTTQQFGQALASTNQALSSAVSTQMNELNQTFEFIKILAGERATGLTKLQTVLRKFTDKISAAFGIFEQFRKFQTIFTGEQIGQAKTGLASIFDFFTGLSGQGQALSKKATAATSTLGNIFKGITGQPGMLGGLTQGVGGFFSKMMSGIGGSALGVAGGMLLPLAVPLLSKSFKGLARGIKKIGKGITDKFRDIFDRGEDPILPPEQLAAIQAEGKKRTVEEYFAPVTPAMLRDPYAYAPTPAPTGTFIEKGLPPTNINQQNSIVVNTNNPQAFAQVVDRTLRNWTEQSMSNMAPGGV